MAKMTKSQLKSYRRFRDAGYTIGEARRLARLTYSQLASEVSRKLREISNRKAA